MSVYPTHYSCLIGTRESGISEEKNTSGNNLYTLLFLTQVLGESVTTNETTIGRLKIL